MYHQFSKATFIKKKQNTDFFVTFVVFLFRPLERNFQSSPRGYTMVEGMSIVSMGALISIATKATKKQWRSASDKGPILQRVLTLKTQVFLVILLRLIISVLQRYFISIKLQVDNIHVHVHYIH